MAGGEKKSGLGSLWLQFNHIHHALDGRASLRSQQGIKLLSVEIVNIHPSYQVCHNLLSEWVFKAVLRCHCKIRILTQCGRLERYELTQITGDLQQFQPKADWSTMPNWSLCRIGLPIWTKINQP